MPLLPMGPPPGGGLAAPPVPQGPPGLPLGAGAPMGGGMGAPVALPPPPAAQAGMAAMSLVPQQMQQQAALNQAQQQEVLAMLMDQLANQPNPAAEAAQGEPAAQVAPGAGAPVDDQSYGGMA